MSVKIVTDSVADLPQEIVKKLGISVVPLVVRFGSEVYHDGVDLSADQFYEKLTTSEFFPVTSVPSPAAFAEVYEKMAEVGDAVLTITLSSKLSGVYDVALQGRRLMKCKCPVEVMDSRTATMCEGFIVMKAAQAANEGATLKEVMQIADRASSRTDFLCTFDTLEYLKKGGRIGAAQAFMGSLLKVNPLITLKDGVVKPAGRTRSRSKAIQSLYEFVKGYSRIEEMAVASTACPEDAEILLERLGEFFPKDRIYKSKMTPAIGAHTGPGLVLVAVMGDKLKI